MGSTWGTVESHLWLASWHRLNKVEDRTAKIGGGGGKPWKSSGDFGKMK